MTQQTLCSLNDAFRRGAPGITHVPGRVVVTNGIRDLTSEEAEPNKWLRELFEVVRHYDDFTPDNDPYGEHDFGAFVFRGERCFWKIDYYDPTLSWGSDAPSDLTKTVRVMTIMLAEEY